MGEVRGVGEDAGAEGGELRGEVADQEDTEGGWAEG